MRTIALALVIGLSALVLHWGAVALWRSQHVAPFHEVNEMVGCPMGYICPVSLDAMRAVLTAPSPETFKTLAPLLLAAAAAVLASVIGRLWYRPPDSVSLPTSPPGLRSIFKRE